MAKNINDSRITEQKDTISQLNMVVNSQNELITSLRSTVEECNATISSLREQVEYLTKKLFGTSSEKSKMVAGQLNLFDEAEQEAQLPEEEAAAETVMKGHTRSARRTNKETFKGVPSRDEVIPLSEDQRRCADCGSEMEVIGKEFVRQEFRFTPAKGEVVNIYRETAKCPRCSACHGPEYPVCEGKRTRGADPAQLCVCLCGRVGHVPEVRKFHAAVPAGTELEADGHPLFQGNAGQLDYLLCHELLQPPV